jgi:hypothetical protein
MPSKKINKVGRPKLPKGEALGRPTPIRFSNIEKAVFEKLAEKEGLTLSQWIRNILNNAVK